jgi:hypothetical protein
MARTEEDMMAGIASPEPEMDSMEEPMPAEAEPEMEESKFDMEMLMGNFMDMAEERRKLATRLLASPAVELFDEIVGEPVMLRLREQLGNQIEVGGQQEEEEAPAGGMMAPTTEPMADMPMEDEESTPPV